MGRRLRDARALCADSAAGSRPPQAADAAADAAEPAGAADDAPALRREALRLWRAAAAAGGPFPSVPTADGLFPVLCAALHPPLHAPVRDTSPLLCAP
jgi:hypothetical protein